MYRHLSAALALFAVDATPAPATAQATATEPVEALACEPDGALLFTHSWTVDDPLSAQGDGLGPVYNNRSCVACHNQGGVGGAGANNRNVLLREGAVLHHFGVSPDYPAAREASLKTPVAATVDPHRMLLMAFGEGGESPLLQSLRGALDGSVHADKAHTDLGQGGSLIGLRGTAGPPPSRRPRLTARNTPALFGAGLLDAVPEEAIIAGLCTTDPAFPEITGRSPIDPASGVRGRFGWKGDVPSLAGFVAGACANELGLEVAQVSQAPDPTNPSGASGGLDLLPADVAALTAYVASLPAPQPLDGQPGATAGEALFGQIGCAACHSPSLGGLDGAYTDLLVHDMGAGLDEQGPTLATYGHRPLQLAREGSDDEPAGSAEWRTPPLWGVADSAPYLHDGRAETLADAITHHGGEARATARRYAALSVNEQAQLIAFLESLAAPRPHRADPAVAAR